MRTPASFYQDPDSFATTLSALMFDQFGPDWLTWDPSVRTDTLEAVYGIRVPETVADKLSAVATLLGTNMFSRDLQAFVAICNAFCGEKVSQNAFFPADLDNCLWGVSEAQLLYGRELQREGFAPEIAAYIGMLLAEKNMTPPDNMTWAIYPAGYVAPSPESFANTADYSSYLQRRGRAEREVVDATVARFELLAAQLRLLPIKVNSEGVAQAVEKLIEGMRK